MVEIGRHRCVGRRATWNYVGIGVRLGAARTTAATRRPAARAATTTAMAALAKAVVSTHGIRNDVVLITAIVQHQKAVANIRTIIHNQLQRKTRKMMFQQNVSALY